MSAAGSPDFFSDAITLLVAAASALRASCTDARVTWTSKLAVNVSGTPCTVPTPLTVTLLTGDGSAAARLDERPTPKTPTATLAASTVTSPTTSKRVRMSFPLSLTRSPITDPREALWVRTANSGYPDGRGGGLAVGVRDLIYGLYERRLAASLAGTPTPRHVGVILDGNRRWARAAGADDVAHGHQRGADHIAELLA